jgi:hypothetical protein
VSLSVCVCVWIFVCMRVCIQACLLVYVCVCASVSVCVRAEVRWQGSKNKVCFILQLTVLLRVLRQAPHTDSMHCLLLLLLLSAGWTHAYIRAASAWCQSTDRIVLKWILAERQYRLRTILNVYVLTIWMFAEELIFFIGLQGQ